MRMFRNRRYKYLRRIVMNKIKEYAKTFLEDEAGMGVIEISLIVITLIALAIIFKKELTSLVNTIIEKMKSQASQV